MNIRSIFIKVIALTSSIFILLSMFIPIIVSASAITDTAKKIILDTIEDIEEYVDEEKYPGYKEKLIDLKKMNSSWKFTLYYTGIEWTSAIYNETKALHGRSLVQGKVGEWICNICGTKVYDSGGWVCASEKAVAYLMDTRNYLSEKYIFQFEELSYNPDTYTIEGIEKVLNGTFMYQKSIKEYYNNSSYADKSFAEAIMEAANTSGVSPYYLAARIRQEIGVNGSDSIYGTYKGYEGIYNFYNIGANSGEDPIGNGLKYASNKTIGKYLLPWNDPVKAIKGGAIWIATNYIAVGQDTLYFQKYDVVSNGTALYNHQYMQNIFAAKSEGYTTYSTYSKLGLLDNNYNFIIPLYENMPQSLSGEPRNIELNTQTGLNENVQLTGDNVILRSYPSTSGSIVATLNKGVIVTRIEKNSAYENGYYWDKVKLKDGTIGYIANKYLSIIIVEDNSSNEEKEDISNDNNQNNQNMVANEIVKVNASNVRVRKSPTTTSEIISILQKNTQVTRIEKKVDYKNGYYWDKVKLTNGTIGYMVTNYLSTTIQSNTNINSEKSETMIVNVNNVRVRKSPTTTSNIISTLTKGTGVIRLEKKVAYKNGYYWDKVKLTNGTIGYIATNYLSSKTNSNVSSSQVAKKGKIKANNVRLRSSAGTSAKILRVLSKGTEVTIVQKKATYKNGYYWDKIKLTNGTIGYIANQYVS